MAGPPNNRPVVCVDEIERPTTIPLSAMRRSRHERADSEEPAFAARGDGAQSTRGSIVDDAGQFCFAARQERMYVNQS